MHPYHGWPFLTSPQYPTLSAVGAFIIHGGVSLLVVAPLVMQSRRRALFTSVAFLAGPALDLDHVVVAGSFRPQALETLAHRPATHSLLFAVAMTVLAWAITRNRTIAWSVFAVIVSHLLFDAAGGNERWLYPLTRPESLPWLACPLGLALLFAISAAVARGERSPRRPSAEPILGAHTT